MRTLRILPAMIGAVFLTLIGATSVVGGADAPELVALARAGADRGAATQVATTPSPVADPATEVVERTNAVRARYGLAPLTIDPRLTQAAHAHSSDQAAHGRMSHTGTNGSTIADRVDASGYPWSRIAENVAAGQRTAADVTDAWLGSSGHRANMLNGSLVHVGVAVVRSSSGTPYWTMVLGAPR